MRVHSRQHLFKRLSSIVANDEFTEIPKAVLQEVMSFFEADAGVIYIHEQGKLSVLLSHCDCTCAGGCQKIDLCFSLPVIRDLANEQQTIFIEYEKRYKTMIDLEGIGVKWNSLVFTPLQINEQIVGVILLTWEDSKKFKENDDELLDTIGNIVGIGLYNGQLIENLKKREDELQFVCQALIHAKEEEGKRISRELHDEVGQDLTSFLLRLKMLQEETNLETIYDRINGLRMLATKTLNEVQRISMDLRPAALDDLGLIPSIRWYIEQYKNDNKIAVQFRHSRNFGGLTEELELVLYRVILEALTNISRHAQASKADIALTVSQNLIVLEISDDGIGMATSNHAPFSLGIMGMQERVKAHHGTFQISSEQGKGTEICITLPYKGIEEGN